MTLRRPPRDQRPLHDAADLTRLWELELAGEPFRHRCVWLLFLDDARRPVGPLITLDDLPDGPYSVRIEDLISLCAEFLDGPGGAESVAFLLSRPGPAPWTVSDRAWGRFLTRAVEQLWGVAWPVHWAHHGRVEEFVLP